MPRKKKIISEKELDKLREVTAYDHHDKQRSNNPAIGMAQFDRVAEEMKTYAYDPHIDPTLQWAGKQEGMSFAVPSSSIHIHESIKPSKILRPVQTIGDDFMDMQIPLFGESPLERQRRHRDELEFYKHSVDWTNRIIAGDSLVIMNSLLEKEGMAGQVQMCYFDPPYGIKYGSNFQPFVNKRDVKDKDEDLSQEPEMITAFRDTWELGIHSYLTYIRDRLKVAHDLLNDTGSVFVQISDENVHHVREICDEIFGAENFITMIYFRTTGGFETNQISRVGDYIVWYAKKKSSMKYHQLYDFKDPLRGDVHGNYKYIELIDGTRRTMTKEERAGINKLPKGAKVFALTATESQGKANETVPFEFKGRSFLPAANSHWKSTADGLKNLREKNRLEIVGNHIRYVRYIDDFPVVPRTNAWMDTLQSGFTSDKIYVVQTNTEIIKRCMLMTTNPDDLVLDITCGSGTTAYVAEQWGRRWITCDTSRIAIELAKERLMTATYDYYRLAHPEQGIASGFVYKNVPHITLKSIANNEPPAEETLYDQPEIDKTKVRVTGPFTVESLPAPVVKPIDEVGMPDVSETLTTKQEEWRGELLSTGILGKNGNRLDFSRVEQLTGVKYFQAEAETKEAEPKRAIICFGSETKVMDARYISAALDEAQMMRPTPGYIIFAAFQFGPEAAQLVDDMTWPGVTVLKVQMNTDLMTEDLKKKRSSNQSFWLIGQPDVELIHDKRTKDRYRVRVKGFDYYDVKTGKVKSGTDSNIAMWMLDIDYDPRRCIEPQQVFFPMGGKKGGWHKLAKTLRAEINQDLIEQYAGNESLWFQAAPHTKIAVKIIDDRGIESLRVLTVEEDA